MAGGSVKTAHPQPYFPKYLRPENSETQICFSVRPFSDLGFETFCFGQINRKQTNHGKTTGTSRLFATDFGAEPSLGIIFGFSRKSKTDTQKVPPKILR